MKNRSLAIALAFFLGGIGIHRFYVNRPKSGLVYALFFWTFIPAALGVIEAIRWAMMDEHVFQEKYKVVVASIPASAATPPTSSQ